MGWRVRERVGSAWCRVRICLWRLSTIRKAISRMGFILTPKDKNAFGKC